MGHEVRREGKPYSFQGRNIIWEGECGVAKVGVAIGFDEIKCHSCWGFDKVMWCDPSNGMCTSVFGE